jgi:Glucodextranase, domain B
MSSRLAGLVLALIVALAVLISAAQAFSGSAPTITITSPKNGAKVTKAQVQVVGDVSKPHDSVTVNGEEVGGIGPTSTIFQKAVSLKMGSNTITATVTSGGLSASDSITVTRVQSTHKRRITIGVGFTFKGPILFPPHGMPVPWNGSVFMDNDDFGKCIAHVKVEVQRKRGKKWRTILTARTEGARPYGHNGGQTTFFKEGPQPPPGTYRFYMPELKFGHDVCLPASVSGRWQKQP